MFKFKQFTINQEGAPFKVGTDSMILGSWVELKGDETVLDIGTGTGVLALMVAQKLNTGKVLAIEIERLAFEIAESNFLNSPFSERLIAVNEPLKKIHPNGKFDLILTNPPYFQDSTKKADRESSTARHTDTLSFDEIAHFCQNYLKEDGRCALVLPVKESKDFKKMASLRGLYLNKELLLNSFQDSEPKRVCMEFSKTQSPFKSENLVIRNRSDGQYTDEYKSLTQEYHLKF